MVDVDREQLGRIRPLSPARSNGQPPPRHFPLLFTGGATYAPCAEGLGRLSLVVGPQWYGGCAVVGEHMAARWGGTIKLKV